jgi:hypothetical protein
MNSDKSEQEPWSAPVTGWIYIVVITLIAVGLITTFITRRSISCLIVGPIIGYWAARRYFFAKSTPHKELVEVLEEEPEDWEKPFPREYQMPLQVVFDGVDAATRKITYNVGDKWRVKSDTFLKKITGELYVKEKQMQEFVEAEIQFEDTEAGGTIIRYEFDCRKDSLDLLGSIPNHYVTELMEAIESKIGPGQKITKPPKVVQQEKTTYDIEFQEVPVPSWKLIAVSFVGLVVFVGDILLELFR